MGLLDKIYGATGTAGGADAQLFDPKMRLLQAALALLADTGQTGGIHGLQERFRAAGLQDVFASWIGDGNNQPISASQVKEVLGIGHIQQIAEETGLGQEEVESHLGEMLPAMVDRLTPSGTLPANGLGDLGTLLEQFMRDPT